MIDGAEALLAHRPAAVAELARQVAAMIAEVRPDLVPAVRSGWGTINYRHQRAGFVCALYPRADSVSLLFERGRLLSSPLLEGDGRKMRFIRLRPGQAIPVDEIAILLAEAIALQ